MPVEKLTGLNDVPWAQLQDAYGSAADVPNQILALISEDADARNAAFEALFSKIWHQGIIYEATIHALRPGSECCDRDLPADSLEARICSFECTFCAACAKGLLAGLCPNCGGELVRRPVRPAARLQRAPAATQRIVKAGGCSAAA